MPELHYAREGDYVHVKTVGLTNHELRCVLLGFWLRLNAEDRADFIDELRHYLTRPAEELPPLTRSVAFGEGAADALPAV